MGYSLFKTFDEENTFNFAFTIVQVPYFIFITTVWGNTDTMKQYQLGKAIKSYRSTLPKNITKCLEDLHFKKYFEANDKLTEKQRKLIEEKVEKSSKT